MVWSTGEAMRSPVSPARLRPVMWLIEMPLIFSAGLTISPMIAGRAVSLAFSISMAASSGERVFSASMRAASPSASAFFMIRRVSASSRRMTPFVLAAT
ncbi:hypothetical protein D3C87_1795320 [compost metagenome]